MVSKVDTNYLEKESILMHNGYGGINSSFERLANLEHKKDQGQSRRLPHRREFISTTESEKPYQTTGLTTILRKHLAGKEIHVFGISSDSTSKASEGKQQDAADEEKYNPHQTWLSNIDVDSIGIEKVDWNINAWKNRYDRDHQHFSMYETAESRQLHKYHRERIENISEKFNKGEIKEYELHKQYIDANKAYY